MNYLSVCSGIESATVAWHPLGWNPVAFSEIEPFPCSVLAHHYPDVPNLGDMTRFAEWPEETLADADLLVGGTPCQAFSVAGTRNSLADARGNLTLTYVQLLDAIDAARTRNGRSPAVSVWENVPGVLSTGDNAFGCFLAALAGEHVPLLPPGGRWTDVGYVRGPRRAVAWRVLDAQYFGLAQRRRRVFIVAGAGEDFRPEKVLFEFKGVRRDSPPRREAGKGVAQSVAGSLGCRGVRSHTELDGHGAYIPEFSHALRGEGFDASEDGTGHRIPVAFNAVDYKYGTFAECDAAGPLTTSPDRTRAAPVVAFNLRGREGGAMPEVDRDGLACQRAASGGSSRSYVAFADTYNGTVTGDVSATLGTQSGDGLSSGPSVLTPMAVRRLTPRECERLQGFPDDWTLVPHRGKPAADGPRYKALGNSKAVPVVRWIGRRIQSLQNR